MLAALQQVIIGLTLGLGVLLFQREQHRCAYLVKALRRRHGESQDRLWLTDVAAALSEGVLVLLYRNAIQRDSLFDTGSRQRQETRLIGHPEHEQVRRHVIAKQALSNRASINIAILGGPGVLVNGAPDRRLGWEEQTIV